MIKNKLVALLILAVLISGTVLFAFYQSPFGPVLTLVGIAAYFIFNKKD
ncbi:MAG: hypothetical protein V1648_00635 [Candidatus Aenigmatarchaeota archaeon]